MVAGTGMASQPHTLSPLIDPFSQLANTKLPLTKPPLADFSLAHLTRAQQRAADRGSGQHLRTVVLNAALLARDTITYSYYIYYVLLSLYLDTSLFLLLVGPAIGVIKAQGATRLFCFCASTE